ncbi:MAG: transporter substrate-binding domain-containing protein [Candidatus Magasanikbacteria bacterium]|nr:transporter substrate-binding domain-containing protein [Candidatus Magasanikbacteria bacterium]
MKKIAFILLFLQFLFFSFSPVLAAVNDPKADQLTVRVGVYDNFPKIYKDEKGQIKGFWADIVNYIAKKENWNIVYVFDTWDKGLENLKNGKTDFMVDVAYSSEREQEFDFNKETVLVSWGIFYTRKGLEINSFSDLNDKKIAILKSGIHYTSPLGLKNIITSFNIKADIVNVENYYDVFKMLSTNEADVGVVSWYYGIVNEDAYQVKRSNIIFDPSELRFALSKNNPKNSYLISTLDSNLVKLKEYSNSVYYNSINNNFGKYLQKIEVAPTWFRIALLILGLLMVIVVIGLVYQKTLRKQIKEKTLELLNREESYKIFIESAVDQIFLLDRAYIFLVVNKSLADFFDKPIFLMNGRSIFEFFSGEMENKIRTNCENVFKTGQGVKNIEEKIVLRKKDFYISISLSPVKNEQGKITAIMGVIRDITDLQEKSEKE